MSKKLSGLLLVVAFLMCMPLPVRAENDFLFKKGDIYVTPMAGGIFYLDDSDADLDDSFIVGGRVGYFLTDNISLEADFDYSWTQFNGPSEASTTPPDPYDGLNANNFMRSSMRSIISTPLQTTWSLTFSAESVGPGCGAVDTTRTGSRAPSVQGFITA